MTTLNARDRAEDARPQEPSRPRRRLRALARGSWLCAPLVAMLAVAATPEDASAQPAQLQQQRNNPVLRTPGRKNRRFRNNQDQDTIDDANKAPTTPATPPVVPPPKSGTAPPASPPPVPGQADDPMAANNVKLGPKEIDFKPQGDAYLVNFNLDDADLPEVVKAISQITGRRFIYGGKLKQMKATVYSPEKVTAGEAYAAFLTILENNGMTVIPHGRYLKIVESQGVVNTNTPVYGSASPVPDEDRYVTRLYHLAHMDAGEASTVLSKFKTKEGDITAYGPSNLLIITETGTNLRRLLRIAEEIDVGGAGEQIYVEPINYSNATEMAAKLNEVLGLQKGGGSGAVASAMAPGRPGAGGPSAGSVTGGGAGARIIADDRANTLIMVATEDDYRRLLELINRMDVKQSGEGEIHVIPLQYAACKDLSATLNQILGQSAVGGSSSSGRPPGAPGGSSSRPVGSSGSTGTGAGGVGLQDEVFEGRIRVTCDESTNSLVTTSSLRDYAQLRNVIDKLDIPRRQVFIEAVVMDVSIDRSTDVNIGYHAGAPLSFGSLGDGVFYGGNNPAASVAG
ncbi:MAG TPA: secretin N-terminal domain-containing protein, partial [Polyangia bacterium]|nr:secretin N-terminal domain-containing protein [Polyangia bacterium]